MGDGLKRAILATIVSRGPWKTVDGYVSTSMVELAYAAVSKNTGITAADVAFAVGLESKAGGSDYRVGRVLQLLRKADLIRFDKLTSRWVGV